MRRGAKFKGLQQKPEIFRSLIFAYPEHGKDQRLYVLAVDPDAPAAYLSAVQHKIVGLCPGLFRMLYNMRHVLVHRSSKRVMNSYIPLFYIVEFKQRKISHPYEVKYTLVYQSKLMTQMHPQSAEERICNPVAISSEQ